MLLNKSDLPPVVTNEKIRNRYDRTAAMLTMSVFNPSDIERLRSLLSDSFLRRPLDVNRSGLIPNLRQKQCLEHCLTALLRAKELLETGSYKELVSLELQAAKQQLSSMLGLDVDRDLLDNIFSRFCIGK